MGHFVTHILKSHTNVSPITLKVSLGLTGLVKVLECDLVDGEEADGGVVFRAHVCDGGPVGDRELRHPWAKELHKPPGDVRLPQVLSGRKDTRERTVRIHRTTAVLNT